MYIDEYVSGEHVVGFSRNIPMATAQNMYIAAWRRPGVEAPACHW